MQCRTSHTVDCRPQTIRHFASPHSDYLVVPTTRHTACKGTTESPTVLLVTWQNGSTTTVSSHNRRPLTPSGESLAMECQAMSTRVIKQNRLQEKRPASSQRPTCLAAKAQVPAKPKTRSDLVEHLLVVIPGCARLHHVQSTHSCCPTYCSTTVSQPVVG